MRVLAQAFHAVTGTDQKEHKVDGASGHNLLELALGSGINIEHACGGVCACSTCHVLVKQGYDKLSPATEAEEDYLDKAEGVTPCSRLACQAVVLGDCTVTTSYW